MEWLFGGNVKGATLCYGLLHSSSMNLLLKFFLLKNKLKELAKKQQQKQPNNESLFDKERLNSLKLVCLVLARPLVARFEKCSMLLISLVFLLLACRD